ncbi:MAG: hypothetical protein ACI8P2_005027 [Candidatus Latescibacterota bacterium]|jgi:hypothetical protein
MAVMPIARVQASTSDGLNKFWWMYAPFDVPSLLGRSLEVSLSKDSGIAGLLFLARQHLDIGIDKTHPGLVLLHDELSAQFAAGRQTSVEWEELEPLARRYLCSA